MLTNLFTHGKIMAIFNPNNLHALASTLHDPII